MGFGTPAEGLSDPLEATVPSGTRANVELGPVTAFRVKRKPTSVGTLRFVAREGQTAPTGDTTGYALTEDDPDSGWIVADKSRWLRVYADGGDVTYEVARLAR